MNIGIVLGTRPEIMKNYAIVKALQKAGAAHEILHTNQHNSERMQKIHFDAAGYQPTSVMRSPYQFGKAVDWVCQEIGRRKISHLLVNGDTAAALVGACSSIYTDTPLAHVEAGLRSFDPDMIEERNRIMVDAAAHYLFPYTEQQAAYLRANKELRGRVILAGNTTVDLIHDFALSINHPPRKDRYAYITLHRKEFTDHWERMESTFTVLNRLITHFDALIFPIHPRTRRFLQERSESSRLLSNITVIEPLSFLQSLSYEKYASLILTDSGCIQEEAYLFGVPCVTVRENTERLETLQEGANILSGFKPEDIMNAIERQSQHRLENLPPVYGPPGAGERIVQAMLSL